MSFSCGFYNSDNGDREYFNEDLSSFLDGLVEDGVYEHIGGHLFVRESATPDMSINVSSGRAWFNSTWTKIDALYEVELNHADAVLNRIDAVCLTVNKTRAVRNNYIEIISGTGATGTPTKPEISDETNIFRHVLAYVTVNHGATAITQANIENRIGMGNCPFSKPIWENVPSTETMVAQWQAQFDEFMDHIHQTFDYDAAGNLLTQIDSLRVKYINCDQPIDSSSSSTLGHVRYDEEFSFSIGALIIVDFSDLDLDGSELEINLGVSEEVGTVTARQLTIPPFNTSNGVCVYRCSKRTNQYDVEEEFYDLVSWGVPQQAALNFSDTPNANLDASKMAVATPKALYSVKSALEQSFQAGVDELYHACATAGVTPAASTPTGIAQAIDDVKDLGKTEAESVTWSTRLELSLGYDDTYAGIQIPLDNVVSVVFNPHTNEEGSWDFDETPPLSRTRGQNNYGEAGAVIRTLYNGAQTVPAGGRSWTINSNEKYLEFKWTSSSGSSTRFHIQLNCQAKKLR